MLKDYDLHVVRHEFEAEVEREDLPNKKSRRSAMTATATRIGHSRVSELMDTRSAMPELATHLSAHPTETISN
jgi:hypothetical protein